MISKDLVPVIVAAVVAVVSTATLFFMDFGPGNKIERSGVNMITAAVVERAGATLTPDKPRVQPETGKIYSVFGSSTN